MDSEGDSLVRALETTEHLARCEELQRVVWSIEDREVVPVSQLRAAQHAGGLVAGAFVADELVGFAYGFPARPTEGAMGMGLHSHMLAVAPGHRGRGIGRTLKWFQRAWSLREGLGWIAWTFDPLQARNANLNLEHLGAVGVAYYPDFYGVLGGHLAGDVATDRLLALWTLDDPQVARLADGGEREPPREVETAPALEAAHGDPGRPRLDLDTARVTIAAPAPDPRLLTERREAADRWRRAQRAAFSAYLGHGYVVTRFIANAYFLEQPFAADSEAHDR